MLVQAMAPSETFIPLLLLFLFYLMATSVSSASDSITINQSLSGNQKLISKGGKFALGFFTNDKYSSHKFYMAIWYNKISEFTPVWTANRATPVADPTRAVLQISQQDGNLVLLNRASFLIWSTNTTTTTTASSTVAVLQDDGNLVLRDGVNSSNVFWQSLDNPTDTLLPGGKLAFNKVTGVSQSLISWKNSDNPAPGIFSYELDPSGANQYLARWNKSKTYWSTGLWDGQIYTGIPEMTGMSSHMGYKMVYVNNDKEKYLAYYVNDDNIITRFVLDVSGQIKAWTWLEATQQWTLFWSRPRAQCDVTAFCGPFGSCNEQTLSYCSCIKGFSQRSAQDWALNDHTGGCARNTPLRCERRNSSDLEQDKFFQMSSVRLPDDAQALQVGGDDECALACLSNCSCTAYSYGTNCSLWHGDLLNLQDQYGGFDGATVNIRLAASEIPSHSKKKSGDLIPGVVGGGVAAFLVCSVVVLIFIVWRRKRNGKLTNDSEEVILGSLAVFKYSDLQRMTKNFSDKLGAGAFGSVFKGVLPDSTAIAVKKLEGFHQGEKQFRAEVSTLGTIQHVNLVALRGFCAEGTQRLLVLDFMAHGSLDSHLFHSNGKVLDWTTRYHIALGIARGLAYLHGKCRECIIHCDIKPENILLDAEFNPMVADFGLAKLLGRDASHVLTSMRGTIGYLAPEWISGLAITPKADVYSFGMMLLELISGRRNSGRSENGLNYFPVDAAIKVREGVVLSLLDERLSGIANVEELNRACRVACWCIQGLESERPAMGMVVQMLEGLLEVSVPPVPRFLQDLVAFSDDEHVESLSQDSTGHGSSSIASEIHKHGEKPSVLTA